jgi:hypothetical protein
MSRLYKVDDIWMTSGIFWDEVVPQYSPYIGVIQVLGVSNECNDATVS